MIALWQFFIIPAAIIAGAGFGAAIVVLTVRVTVALLDTIEEWWRKS